MFVLQAFTYEQIGHTGMENLFILQWGNSKKKNHVNKSIW